VLSCKNALEYHRTSLIEYALDHPTPMEQPIVIRFRWTADELLQANRYHFRHTCRPIFRFGLHFIFAFLFLGGVLMLTMPSPDGKTPLPLSIGFLIAGIYWFAVRPFERRWTVRRQISKRPDRDLDIEWQVAADKILAQSALARSEVSWQAFTKVVRTPAGVLLYPFDRLFHWLPRHGFANDVEFEKFVELAKGKVPRHFDVA